MAWQEIDLNFIDLTRLEKNLQGSLAYLVDQIQHEINHIRFIRSRSDTVERPTGIEPRPNTEHWLSRGSSRLLIAVGESFTWSENLYGMAGQTLDGPVVHSVIQCLFTIQGRLASQFGSDLRSVTVPGNANVLMIAALQRVLEEISSLNQWEEIIVLQQFTERSRCQKTVGHPSIPWYNQWTNPNDIFSDQWFIDQEQFLLERLDQVIADHGHLPIKCWAWRNFDPWIVCDLDQFKQINFVKTSMNEFKYVLHGLPIQPHPVCIGSEYFQQLISHDIPSEHLDWLSLQVERCLVQQDWIKHNRFQDHPRANMTLLWARYLTHCGVHFG